MAFPVLSYSVSQAFYKATKAHEFSINNEPLVSNLSLPHFVRDYELILAGIIELLYPIFHSNHFLTFFSAH